MPRRCSAAGRSAARRGADQRLAAGRPRLLLDGHVRDRPARRRSSARKTVIAQINPAMPRTLGDSFVHVDDIDLGVEVDVPPYAHAAAASRRCRAAHRRLRRRSGARRRDGPDGHRRDPVSRRRRPRRQARPGHPHRDDDRRRARPCRARRRHRPRQGDQSRPRRGHVHARHAAALRLGRRQPHGRDAPAPTTPTTRP